MAITHTDPGPQLVKGIYESQIHDFAFWQEERCTVQVTTNAAWQVATGCTIAIEADSYYVLLATVDVDNNGAANDRVFEASFNLSVDGRQPSYIRFKHAGSQARLSMGMAAVITSTAAQDCTLEVQHAGGASGDYLVRITQTALIAIRRSSFVVGPAISAIQHDSIGATITKAQYQAAVHSYKFYSTSEPATAELTTTAVQQDVAGAWCTLWYPGTYLIIGSFQLRLAGVCDREFIGHIVYGGASTLLQEAYARIWGAANDRAMETVVGVLTIPVGPPVVVKLMAAHQLGTGGDYQVETDHSQITAIHLCDADYIIDPLVGWYLGIWHKQTGISLAQGTAGVASNSWEGDESHHFCFQPTTYFPLVDLITDVAPGVEIDRMARWLDNMEWLGIAVFNAVDVVGICDRFFVGEMRNDGSGGVNRLAIVYNATPMQYFRHNAIVMGHIPVHIAGAPALWTGEIDRLYCDAYHSGGTAGAWTVDAPYSHLAAFKVEES